MFLFGEMRKYQYFSDKQRFRFVSGDINQLWLTGRPGQVYIIVTGVPSGSIQAQRHCLCNVHETAGQTERMRKPYHRRSGIFSLVKAK